MKEYVPPMVRNTDSETSHETADVMRPKIGRIQAKVIRIFAKLGPMTARVAERRPEFENYGYSTIRKRICELHKLGFFEVIDIDRSEKAPASIYMLKDEWKERLRPPK